MVRLGAVSLGAVAVRLGAVSLGAVAVRLGAVAVRLGADGLRAAWSACETGAGSNEEEHMESERLKTQLQLSCVHLKHLKPVQPVMHGSGTLTTTGIIFVLL